MGGSRDDRKISKFADAGVRDIKSYNAKMDKLTNKDDPDYQKMPQIVIIVDGVHG
ncbi:MAG: hypothetical protein ACLSD6_09570 [Clostridium sp.]